MGSYVSCRPSPLTLLSLQHIHLRTTHYTASHNQSSDTIQIHNRIPHRLSITMDRSRSPHKNLQWGEAHQGLFCLLPQWDEIPKNSIVHQQEHLNPGFAGHSTLIIELSDNGRMARCLQSTSFSKTVTLEDGTIGKRHQTAMEKFPASHTTSNILRSQHLPVSSNYTSVSHDNLPLLKLQYGVDMSAQSFVKLDHYFEIETSLLIRWSQIRYALTEDSLCGLMHYFQSFISGNTDRVAWILGRPMSPLDLCGAPLLTGRSCLRAAGGCQLEMFRVQGMARVLAFNVNQQYQQQPMMYHGQRPVRLHESEPDVVSAQQVEVSSLGGVTYYQYAGKVAA
jgi:hypothetical protein